MPRTFINTPITHRREDWHFVPTGTGHYLMSPYWIDTAIPNDMMDYDMTAPIHELHELHKACRDINNRVTMENTMSVIWRERVDRLTEYVNAIDDAIAHLDGPSAEEVRMYTSSMRTELELIQAATLPQRGDKTACIGANYKDRG